MQSVHHIPGAHKSEHSSYSVARGRHGARLRPCLAQDEQVFALAQLLRDGFALIVQPESHAEGDREALQSLKNLLLRDSISLSELRKTSKW